MAIHPHERLMSRPGPIILDYGNVLSRPQRHDRVASMAARLDVPTDLFAASYVAERPPYDGGEPPNEYWRRVVSRLGRSALFSPSLLALMIEDDTASWDDYREEVWDMVARFRARGGRAAFLSNNVPPLMARLRAERHIDDVFDVVTASCEVGVAKPGAAIFQLCLDALAVAPGEALFVDDHPANIAMAASLGIATFHFEGEDAVKRLDALVESRLASV
jgi:putative hydrolase of the HAD superfamily